MLACGQDYVNPASLRYYIFISDVCPLVSHQWVSWIPKRRAKHGPGFWTLASSELSDCGGDRPVTNNHIHRGIITIITVMM